MGIGARAIAVAVLMISCAGLVKSQTSNTTVSETRDMTGNVVPQRVTVTRSEVNGRIVETQTIETPSINGGYTLVSATESEEVRQSDGSVRVMQRSYMPDPQGGRALSAVTESVTTPLGGGREKTITTISTPDLNGQLQMSRREEAESTSIDANTKQTKMSVYTQGSGGLERTGEVHQVEHKVGGVTDIQRTDRAVDPNGNMVTIGVSRRTETEADGAKTTREQVLGGDPGKVAGEGAMQANQVTTTKEWKDADGQQHSSVNSYSRYTPGVANDEMRLTGSATAVRRTAPDGSEQTVQEVRQAAPGEPAGTLQPAAIVVEFARPTSGGDVQSQRTVKAADGNGSMQTVWVTDSKGTRKIP